ncbi:polysaccharide lyase family 8 protein [Roridomyces roridus]|uniref:Polysaccharide lyase family 8 protein n=1 Tax=Roridomyces roridus TaxID=1738132 RepID=A0AAD7BUF5_9AGAR|nr:polysaccharide lyase family 8 protein [Roridomyces roridus]
MRTLTLFSSYILSSYSLCVLASSANISTPSTSSTLSSLSSSIPTSSSGNATISATSSLTSSVSPSSSVVPSSTSSSTQPSASVDPTTAQEIATIHERRLSNIVGALTNATSIPTWIATLEPNGQWPDVDYTTGCPAQRANWPAELHWNRISTMAGAWNGGLAGAEQYVKDPGLRANISLAMSFWFDNDFTNNACLDQGGQAPCPCSTPGFWNTNWFPNIIGTPELVSISCLLLNDTLSDNELQSCVTITGRAYALINANVPGVGFFTGANLLDVAKIGIDQALLTVNVSMLTSAYTRIHQEVVIENGVSADGIRADGSFGQHAGILYNGNYGKDYTNDVVDLEVEAGGTQFQATSASQTALATLFDGDRWMIYMNALTGVLHWDFSVLGRFIVFPTADITQATASILLNLTKIENLGEEWDSETLEDFATSLSMNVTSANAGNLQGTRMFYDNDYMVHRGSNHVTSLKMYSTRSRNSECTNLANPFGFHLSDGALRTYVQGNEYEDIAASMNWDLIPGITVDLNATPLTCGQTQFVGIENFVGGVSDGTRGIGAMRYSNPLTHNLHWQKTWFFLDDDVQFVMVSNLTSATNATVVSVLDQKLHRGSVMVDSARTTESVSARSSFQTLWHSDVGYTFPDSSAFSLSVQVGEEFGNWTVIGTSPQPPVTVDLFSAWLTHQSLNASLAYMVYPGTSFDSFIKKSTASLVRQIRNDASVSAVMDEKNSIAMAVFWAGGLVDFAPISPATFPFSISTNGTAAVMYNWKTGDVTVSDPTQTLTAVSVTFTGALWKEPNTVVFTLPTGGVAGSSVTQNIRQ